MKNRHFGQSIVCAARGIVQGFRSERNFKIYCLLVSIFLIFNILLSVGVYDYIILIVLTGNAFALEYVNTAIERVVDRFGKGIDVDCKFIKDVAAGAVLVSGIVLFLVEGIILIPRLVERLL